ncbi:MAG: signal peptidase II [Deltaproteobacteria bacterium]|nr:signal peptidase II [Deltaproteobacteria bacterium]
MTRPIKILALGAPSIVLLDQITKILVEKGMRLGEISVAIDGILNLAYVRNAGAAFGLFSSIPSSIRSPLFVTISLIAIGIIFFILRKIPSQKIMLPVGLTSILGGAIGNLLDRIRLGYVIDFIDVHWKHIHWPAFNVADIAITVGVALILIDGWGVKSGDGTT